jgi:hypothetical protein
MRKKTIAQRSLFDQAIDALRSVFKPEKKLTALDKIITDNPGLVQAIHADITQQVRKIGREGISAERILRTAIVKQWKNYYYREHAEQLHGSVPLRWFTRFYAEPIPHYTALQKAIKAIGAPILSAAGLGTLFPTGAAPSPRQKQQAFFSESSFFHRRMYRLLCSGTHSSL